MYLRTVAICLVVLLYVFALPIYIGLTEPGIHHGPGRPEE
jgi:hypothetical protein